MRSKAFMNKEGKADGVWSPGVGQRKQKVKNNQKHCFSDMPLLVSHM